jgi:dCMP deaminase
MAKKKRPPREVVSREEYYMAKALWASTRSKDPDTQVGAQIVTVGNKPLGYGYNGPPSEITDHDMDWSRPEKNPYIIHAEKNAIRFSDQAKLQGSTIYITGRPCRGCMLDIVGSGITKIVYLEPKRRIVDAGSILSNQEEWALVQDIAQKGRVTLTKFAGNLSWMRDQMMKWELLGYFD